MSTHRVRQGDILANSVDKLPVGAVPIKQKPIALGEWSNHQHVCTGDVSLFEFEGRIYAAVGSDGGLIQHVDDRIFTEADYARTDELPIADHGAIALKPNTVYAFSIQNVYNPFYKALEAVRD